MFGWLERELHRQRDLQDGVDADLVRDNRRRYKLSALLLGCAFLLSGILAKVGLPEPWQAIVVALTMALFVGGMIIGHWAWREWIFLRQPDPKEPPSLLK
jgi:hypothetical protein